MKHKHFLGSVCRFMLEKKRIWVHLRHRLKGFNNEKYVCATISYMQLLLPVSAVVTIEMGSRLTTSCQSLATVLSPLNWQPFASYVTYPLSLGDDLCRCECVHVPEVAVKWSNRPRRGGKYQGSPESSGGSVLCLIEPDPLILENKLKICFSLQALTRVAQLKETIAVWH